MHPAQLSYAIAKLAKSASHANSASHAISQLAKTVPHAKIQPVKSASHAIIQLAKAVCLPVQAPGFAVSARKVQSLILK